MRSLFESGYNSKIVFWTLILEGQKLNYQFWNRLLGVHNCSNRSFMLHKEMNLIRVTNKAEDKLQPKVHPKFNLNTLSS